MKKTYCLLLFFIFCFAAQAQFGTGNIVVSEITDNATLGSEVVIKEYLPGTAAQASAVNSFTLNQTAGSTPLFSVVGRTDLGFRLSLSLDGKYITLGGYNGVATETSANLKNSTITRTIAKIDGSRTVSYSSNASVWEGNGNIRDVLSVDGTKFWTTCQYNPLRYILGELATSATASTSFAAADALNATGLIKKTDASVLIVGFDNTASGAANFIWSPVNTTTGAVAAGTTVAYHPAGTTTLRANSFVFLDLDTTQNWNGTGYDVLYVSHYGATYADRGIYKYYWDNTSATWTLVGNRVADSAHGGFNTLTAVKKAGGGVTIYALTNNGQTVANKLVTFDDTAAYNVAMSISTSYKTLATADATKVFKGISIAPTATTTPVSYTNTWTGAVSTDYATAGNWSGSTLPTATSTISIPAGLTNYPVINSNQTIAGGNIASGATLTVAAGIVLTNNGTLTNSGNLILKASASGTGSLVSAITVNNVTTETYSGGTQTGFTKGNVLVSEITDSATTGSEVTIKEYLPGTAAQATAVNSFTLNQTNVALPYLSVIGRSDITFRLSLSLDGQYITLGGHNGLATALASALRSSSTTVKKTIAKIDAARTVTYSSNTTIWENNGLIRDVLSVDGSKFWTASHYNNLRYILGESPTSSTASTSFINTLASLNTSGLIKKTDGTVLVVAFDNTASGAASFLWSTVNTGDGTVPAGTTVPYNPAGTTTLRANSFAFFDLDATQNWNGTGYDVLYVSHYGTTYGDRGIYKYYWDNTSATWTLIGAKVADASQGGFNTMTAVKKAGGGVKFYALTNNGQSVANKLVTFDDTAAYNAAINIGTSYTTLATAGATKVFKGISMAPAVATAPEVTYTNTWTGASSTDFNTAGNWSGSTLPTATSTISIPAGLTNYPVINTNLTVAGGNIATGATLTVAEGKVLTNTGTLTNTGDLILKSTASGTGSLVSTTSVNNVTQQRYFNSNQRGWRLVSNPVSTKSFNDLGTASNITVESGFTGQYAPATDTWTSTDGSVNMTAQQAYKVFITGRTGEAPSYANGISNVTLVNKGTAANTAPATVTTTAGRYYLVANPYTAPVSISSVIATSAGTLSSTISYYNPTKAALDAKKKAGGYDVITNISGAAGSDTDVLIPAMGAIFVYAITSGTFSVPKTAIFTGTSGSTLRKAQTKVAAPVGLTLDVSSNGINFDKLQLRFKEAGTAGSNVDFGKLPNTFLDLYSIDNSKKMAVSELELAAQTIPLGITSTIKQGFSFKVVENTIPTGFEAVLVDNVLNTNTVLVPGTNYDFAIDNNVASQGNARFAINLRTAAALGVKANELEAKIQVYPNPSRGEFNITNTLNQGERATIEISNLNGQLIHSQKLNSGTTTIQTKSWATGIYILKASNNGTQTTKKLIIQ